MKIPLKALCNRLIAKVKAYTGRDKFGFIAGRGTRAAIALLRIISEKAIDHCKDVFVAFVDYEKAFDCVHWPKLMEILAKIGVDYRDRKIIWNLYMNQTVSVMIDGELFDPAIIGCQTRRTVINNTLHYLC